METMDWAAIGAAIAAFLALVANIFSALGAARSADLSARAEERARTGERHAAARELRRSLAIVEAEAQLTFALIEECEQYERSIALLTGGRGGSREKLLLTKYEDRRREVEALKLLANRPESSTGDEQVLRRQLQLDEALISARATKERTQRELIVLEQTRMELQPLRAR